MKVRYAILLIAVLILAALLGYNATRIGNKALEQVPFKMQVKGSSMYPNYMNNEWYYYYRNNENLKRGDVIYFKNPINPDLGDVRRLIGLPGDTIKVSSGMVYVNGVALHEPYTTDKTNLWEGGYIREDEALRIPADQFFVLGDNRPRSSDSRDFGFVRRDLIIGVLTTKAN